MSGAGNTFGVLDEDKAMRSRDRGVGDRGPGGVERVRLALCCGGPSANRQAGVTNPTQRQLRLMVTTVQATQRSAASDKLSEHGNAGTS